MTSAVLGQDKPQILNDLLAIGGKLVLDAGKARISPQKRNDFHLRGGEGFRPCIINCLEIILNGGGEKLCVLFFFG